MPCGRALEIDLKAYLTDPADDQWTEIRGHFPHCAECRAVLHTSVEFEEALAPAAGSQSHPAPRDLLAYQHDALDPSTRAGLEQHLEDCASCREELATIASLAASSESSAPKERSYLGAARESVGTWIPAATPRHVAMGTLSVTLIAAAIWVRVSAPPGSPIVAGNITEAQRGAPSRGRAEVPPEESAPMVSDNPVEIAQAPEVPAPEPHTPTPDAGREPAPAPEPRRARERASPGEVATPVPPPAPTPRAEPQPEPVFVAMVMPEYALAADADPRRTPRGIQREMDSVAVSVLAPAHVARTSRARPDLYWYLSSLSMASGEPQLVVSDPQSGKLLVEAALPVPATPGLQRVDPVDLGADLPIGREICWSVALVRPGRALPSAFSTGWIRRVGPTAELEAQLTGTQPGAVPAAYAGSGFWYDALASAIALERERPGDPEVVQAVRLLLQQAGLGELPGATSRIEAAVPGGRTHEASAALVGGPEVPARQ